MDHGMLDLVEPRENVRRSIRNLLELHELAEAGRRDDGAAKVGRLPETEGAAPVKDSSNATTRCAGRNCTTIR